MPRIHIIVKETAKVRYQAQASREGKSLGEWMREAAEEKMAASRTRRFTAAELHEFAAACDMLHPAGASEPDWPDVKRLIRDTRYPGPGAE